MNTSQIVVAILLLGGCSTTVEREQDALMSRLEHNLRLPEGASDLREYARYYADSGNGEIAVIYLIPFGLEKGPDDSCEEMLADFSTREVPCPEFQPAWAMAAGKRRWLDDYRDLPWINDGGCAQIEVIFDKETSAVKRAECNGEA